MAAGWYGHNTFIKIELPWKMIGKINLASKSLRTTAALVFSDFFFFMSNLHQNQVIITFPTGENCAKIKSWGTEF